MKNRLFDLIAPHYCCSCGKIGQILCDNCKNNITQQRYTKCLICEAPATARGLCEVCRPPFSRAWCVGERHDALENLINVYKFERAMSAADTLVDLLDEITPDLPQNVIITSVPTISSHVRERGYDHAARVAKKFAHRRGLKFRAALERQTSAVQHGASRQKRQRQARQAFACDKDLTGQKSILFDDIYTTGATMKYASRELLRAGADEVWVLVLARQPIRK